MIPNIGRRPEAVDEEAAQLAEQATMMGPRVPRHERRPSLQGSPDLRGSISARQLWVDLVETTGKSNLAAVLLECHQAVCWFAPHLERESALPGSGPLSDAIGRTPAHPLWAEHSPS